MTPEEIKTIRNKVTQQHVDAFVDYMDNWMKASKQPSKDLRRVRDEMLHDKSLPSDQMTMLLGSLYDWFAYGN